MIPVKVSAQPTGLSWRSMSMELRCPQSTHLIGKTQPRLLHYLKTLMFDMHFISSQRVLCTCSLDSHWEACHGHSTTQTTQMTSLFHHGPNQELWEAFSRSHPAVHKLQLHVMAWTDFPKRSATKLLLASRPATFWDGILAPTLSHGRLFSKLIPSHPFHVSAGCDFRTPGWVGAVAGQR